MAATHKAKTFFTAETQRRREINEKGETIQFYNPLFFLSASASLR
jgi:hypothetical protein